MIFLKLLLSSGLIFFNTATSITDKQFILLDYIKPEHYDIKLVPYVIPYNQDIFYGECSISINILQPTHTINLYSDVRCILNIKLTDNPSRFQQCDEKKIVTYKPINYLRDSKTQIAEFFFKNKLSSGRFILNIKFIGVTADNGGFRTFSLMKNELNHVIADNGSSKTFPLIESKNNNGGRIAATHYQTIGARRLFPCWDKPELKATFNISIILPRNYMTFSNMRTRKIEILKSKRLLIHYDTTPLMSTSIVAAVILNRAELFIRTTLGSASYMWNRKFISDFMFYTQSIVQKITMYLKNEWKRSSKILKIDHVVIPDFYDENMINLGLVLYKEFDVAYKETIYPVGHKIKVLRLVVSKVIREWFSFRWSHSWLTEAFISFFGAYVVDKIIPDSRMMDLFVVQIQQECLHLDANYNMWSISSKINSEIPYYIRASVILHMLQHTIGEEAFWKGIHIYIRAYIYDNTNKWGTFDDFWTAMQTAFDEIPYLPFERFNITKQMDPWMQQKHYPILKVIRNPGGFRNITLEILNTSNNWSIPLTYTTQADFNFNNILPEIWLNMSDMGNSVHILDFADCSDRKLNETEWIIFNLKQTGYYRVNYDAKNWQLISDYLDSPHFTNIHVLNRAQLIDDAFHLMIARQLDSSIFWNLTKYLHREEDYVAWYPMFKALEQMSSVFQLQDPEVDAIKENMNKIFNILLQKLEYDEIIKYSDPIEKYEPDFRKSLRQEAAKWACLFGEISCKIIAHDILINYWPFQRKIINILPWWKEWTYCNGLAMVDHSTWWEIFNTLENNYDNRLIKLLACARPYTVKSYLTTISNTIIMQQSSKNEQLGLLAKDFVDSFPFIIAKHVKDKDMLSYILYELLYFIEPRTLSSKFNMIAILTIIINHVHSQQELNVINNYINNITTTYETIKFSTTERRKVWENIAQHVSTIYNKIQIRESEIKSQKKYLQSFKLNNKEL